MAKFDKQVLLSAINLRLLDPEIKTKCLEQGLAFLEDIIRKVIRQINNTLEWNLADNHLHAMYYSAFLCAQDELEVNYDLVLTEKIITQYVTEYLKYVEIDSYIGRQYTQILNVDLGRLFNYIKQRLSDAEDLSTILANNRCFL